MTSPLCAEEAGNRSPNILGCPGFQSDTGRNLADGKLGQLWYTLFGQFFALFAIFQPLWSCSEAPEEPMFPVQVPLNLQKEHGEL